MDARELLRIIVWPENLILALGGEAIDNLSASLGELWQRYDEARPNQGSNYRAKAQEVFGNIVRVIDLWFKVQAPQLVDIKKKKQLAKLLENYLANVAD